MRVAQAIANHPHRSNRRIARELGVDERTVRTARALAGADHSAPERRQGLDGRWHPAKRPLRYQDHLLGPAARLDLKLMKLCDDYYEAVRAYIATNPGREAVKREVTGALDRLTDLEAGLEDMIEPLKEPELEEGSARYELLRRRFSRGREQENQGHT
jgi:hypothetical protein